MDELGDLILGEPQKTSPISDKLLDSLRHVESGKNPYAVNKETKAMGAYQFMPDTVAMLHKQGIKFNPFDEQEARQAAKTYLEQLTAKNGGDVNKALAQYGGFVTKNPSEYVGKVMGGAKQAQPAQPTSDELGQLILGGEPSQQPAQRVSPLEAIKQNQLAGMQGVGEAGRSLLSGLVAPVIGGIGGVATTLTSPDFGTQKGIQQGQQKASDIQEQIQKYFAPKSQAGQNIIENIGSAMEASKVPPAFIPELPKMAPQAGNVASELNWQMANKTPIAEELQRAFISKQAAPLAGVGAAEVQQANLRRAKAQELPIPIDLTKGQETRNFGDVQFERETAKNPQFGQPLQEKFAEQNAKIQQNLQKLVDMTGAEEVGIGPDALGEKVRSHIEGIKKERKAVINKAYDAAKAAGEMEEPVSYKPILDYIENNRPTVQEQNPILRAVKEELAHNDPEGTGKISLAAMEDIRQLINAETEPHTSNAFHGNKIIKQIDNVTNNAGGQAYQTARKLYSDYMKEFENVGVTRDITRLKKGTIDPVVRNDQMLEHILIKQSPQSVRAIFGTLEKTPEGQQIINELRGALADKIREESVKGVGRDVNGKPYVSTAMLDKQIRELDKNGKLDLIFGKEIANHYRTLNDVTKDLQTTPVGSVGTSNTASSLLAALAETGAATAMTGIPVPVVSVIAHGRKELANRAMRNRVAEHVNPKGENK